MGSRPIVRCSTRPGEDVIEAIVRAVASYTNTEPLELPPLANVVDPDALDALVTGALTGIRVSFVYGGCEVVLETGEDGAEIAVVAAR